MGVYEGDRYTIITGKFYSLNQAGTRTKGRIKILDRATGKAYSRMAYGQQIGNFHPIWVSLNGKKVQLETLRWEKMPDGS